MFQSRGQLAHNAPTMGTMVRAACPCGYRSAGLPTLPQQARVGPHRRGGRSGNVTGMPSLCDSSSPDTPTRCGENRPPSRETMVVQCAA